MFEARQRTGPPLADLAVLPDGPPTEYATDIVIVGAGPAGLTAALHLARAGRSVLVLDERPQPGGQYLKPIAPSHTEAGPPLDRQFALSQRLRGDVAGSGAVVWQDASVWAAFAPDELCVMAAGRHRVVRARHLVLAPGAYERPVPIPGWTLPGVMTAGAAQTLLRAYRVAPGQRIVVAGNGPLNVQLAAALCEAGVTVVALIEHAPNPSRSVLAASRAALADPRLMAEGAAYLATVRRHGVPILWGSQVVAAEGDAHVTGCIVRGPDGTRRLLADTLVLGHGLIPSTDLARQLGCRHVFVDRGLGYLATVTSRDGRTSVPGVFAVGDGAVPGGAAVAMHRAVLTAEAILQTGGGTHLARPILARASRKLRRAERFQHALWTLFRAPPFDVAAIADDTIVCRCESVRAGRVRAVLTTEGADAGTAKRLTRIGMGSCGGRYCAATLARLVHAQGGAPPGEFALFAPRPSARPVPLAALAVEQPEWGGHRRSVPPAAVPRPTRPSGRWTRRETDVLVIGAGVVGACVARELAREGVGVLVVDRDEPGQQASTANAGSLHVQLLSFDFGAKAEAGGMPAAETLRLGPPAMSLWRDIALEAGTVKAGEDLGLHVTGGLMLAETEADLAFLRQKAELEAQFGVTTHVIGANELRSLEPALSTRMIGAALCPDEGKIDPLAATFAVIRQARAAGAVFEADAAVLGIEPTRDGYLVQTEAGPVRAGRIVNCAGAWTALLSSMVGKPIPVSGAQLQMIVTQGGPKLVSHLLAHASRHLSLKQTAAGALLIGGGWSAGLDTLTGNSRALRHAIEGNAWVACRVLPAAAGFNLLRVWAGMNIAIDGAPILGEMPGAPGFWNCVTSNGYTLAPIVARLTAEAMLGRPGSLDIRPFLLSRFG